MKRLLVYLTSFGLALTIGFYGWGWAAAVQARPVVRDIVAAGAPQEAQVVVSGNLHIHSVPAMAAAQASTGSEALLSPQVTSASTKVLFGGLLGFAYQPAEVHVRPGQSVNWQGDFILHPLVSDNTQWITVTVGTSFTQTFNTIGIYKYHCGVHGILGMTGSVTVDKAAVFLPLATR
jgi:plastocyanin